jgi:predicted CXXCH cytochrome family protein
MNQEREEVQTVLRNFPDLKKEWLIHLKHLSDDASYQVEIVVKDRRGSSNPEMVDIVPGNIWVPEVQRPSLKLMELSRVTVDEIKKRAFVRASISWDTDVLATSEMEYRLKGSRPRKLRAQDLFTKDHQIFLDGLKHKSTYYFRAVSRDIYGNTLMSDEYELNTSGEFSRLPEFRENNSALPVIENTQVFKTENNNGIYLKVSASKRSRLSVKIKKADKSDDKHGKGLASTRYAQIDACYKCHPHDSSHPVGVKATGKKTKTPEGLPTLEDGTITCVTCHHPHGGKRPFYNRFDFRKDLCMKCHLKKYGM